MMFGMGLLVMLVMFGLPLVLVLLLAGGLIGLAQQKNRPSDPGQTSRPVVTKTVSQPEPGDDVNGWVLRALRSKYAAWLDVLSPMWRPCWPVRSSDR